MNLEELKQIKVLAAMDDLALGRLAGSLEKRNYTDAQRVFAEGESADSMYFIAAGRVRIEKCAHPGSVRQKTLTVLERGDYFGEMALLDQKPRSASAVVAGGATLLRLSKAAFDLLQHASTAQALGVLFAMIRTSSDRIRRLSAQLVVYDEVGKALGAESELQPLLDIILQQLSFATSADWGFVALRSQFSERLELRSVANLTLTRQQSEAIAAGQGFLGPTLEEPQEKLVDNFDEEHKLNSQRLGFETASMILSPIVLKEQILGMIVLGGQERAQFDLDGLCLTRGIARQAAHAILNARHREEDQARTLHARQYVRF